VADHSGIEWTDATWNPVTGCTEVSPGCDHCYAKTFAERFRGVPGHHFERGFDVQLRPERLDQPLRWRRPRRIFVNSMSDLFHKDVPEEFIGSVWNTIALTPQHTYQILTKRPGRMRSLLRRWAADGWCWRDKDMRWCGPVAGPLPNVWLGVSCEDQRWADCRVPALLETPAVVRFVSCEPLLGAVDLSPWLVCEHPSTSGTAVPRVWECDHCGVGYREVDDPDGPVQRWSLGRQVRRVRYEQVSPGRLLDWVIAGGESGHGARPMHPAWVRSLRDQCQHARVPFLFKQWGMWRPASTADRPSRPVAYRELDPGRCPMVRVGKGAAGRVLDGQTWDQFPTTHVDNRAGKEAAGR
jgi:protein gp37